MNSKQGKPLNHKALEILRNLDEKELDNFTEFIKFSGYFDISRKAAFIAQKKRKKENKSLIPFYKVIKEFYPYFSDGLTNDYLAEKFGSDSNIKKLFGQLEKMCEHFLVLQEIAIDKYYYDEALLYQLQRRNLRKNYLKILKKTEDKLNVPKSYNIKDYFMRFNMESTRFMMNSTQIEMKRNSQLEEVIKLQTTPACSLLFYFVFDSMKLIVNMIGNSNSYKLNLEENEFFKIFKECFPDKRIKEIAHLAIEKSTNPLIKKIITLYWLNYLFRTTDDKKKAGIYFRKYFEILEKISNYLGEDERFEFYHESIFGFWLALEFPEFEKLEFDFYDSYLKNEAYKASGRDKMTLLDFKNLLIRGDNTRRFEWTTNILENHINKVSEKYHETLKSLRAANLSFIQDKDFGRSLEELRKINRNQHYTISADILVLYIKIYFERKQYDSAMNKLESLGKYLKSQKIGTVTAEPFQKFITYTMKLINYKVDKIAIDVETIRSIKKDNLIVSKDWLREKISQLQL